jgi:predicted DNA-binding transcriptional regulator AlpA
MSASSLRLFESPKGDIMRPIKHMIPASAVAERHGVSLRTITRREKSEALGFPRSVRINGRRFWRLKDIEAWEAAATCNTSEAA